MAGAGHSGSHWPRFPGTCCSRSAAQSPATLSWKGLGGGDTRVPAAYGVAGWFVPLVGAQPGSPERSGRGTRVQGQACGTGLCSWGGPGPGCPTSSSANGSSRCPGMSWQEGPGPQSKQTPRRRLGEGQEAVFPLPSPTPARQSEGGSKARRAVGAGEHPPARSKEARQDAHPNRTFLGAEELLTWCQGTPRPSGRPAHAAFAGKRASRRDGSLPRG